MDEEGLEKRCKNRRGQECGGLIYSKEEHD